MRLALAGIELQSSFRRTFCSAFHGWAFVTHAAVEDAAPRQERIGVGELSIFSNRLLFVIQALFHVVVGSCRIVELALEIQLIRFLARRVVLSAGRRAPVKSVG